MDELARTVSSSAPLTESGSADKTEQARERLAHLNQACSLTTSQNTWVEGIVHSARPAS